MKSTELWHRDSLFNDSDLHEQSTKRVCNKEHSELDMKYVSVVADALALKWLKMIQDKKSIFKTVWQGLTGIKHVRKCGYKEKQEDIGNESHAEAQISVN